MIDTHKKICFSLGLIALCLILFVGSHRAAADNLIQPVSVQIADLKSAGYAVLKQEIPTATLYNKPTLYFRVSDPKQKAPTDNLIVISQVYVGQSVTTLFDYGTDIKNFPITGGTGQEGIIDKGQRTVINFIKDGMYVVVMGPNTTDLESLAKNIAVQL